MYFDGSYTLKGVGAGVMLIPLECDILKYAIQLDFPATNNIVEYKVWHPDSRLNRIDRILIPLRYTFFFRSPTEKNSELSVFSLEQFQDG
jgi:hypothetical protein